MKKWLLFVPLFTLLACGDGESKEELKFETFEEKLSFVLGAQSAKGMLENQQISGDKLTKERVIDGFKSNFTNTFPEDCQATMEGLYGANGTDFNTKYLEDGSECVGRFMGYTLYADLERFEKVAQIDTILLYRGFEEGLAGNDTTFLTMEEQLSVNEEFTRSLEAIMQQQMEDMFRVNKEEGEAFLLQNGQREGVITTPSGLQYEVLKQGNGPKPTALDQVTVHYHGTLINGTVFDSSVERGEPYSTPLNQVIPGWTEVVQLMNKGSKFKVYIPTELAYGANPHPGGPIEPYMALIFEIELIDF